jgi:tRNA (cytidine/uridine-2'-O-)-methyltransferase
LRLALYEPDIPQNTGALLRLAACFGVGVDLIEPLGFLFDDRRLKRAALDYAALAAVTRHAVLGAFHRRARADSRLVLMTTSGAVALDRFAFAPGDTILLGRESAGVPARCTTRPMRASSFACARRAIAQRRAGRGDRALRGAAPDRPLPAE